MGVDVNLYAIGSVTDERLAEACAFIDARVGRSLDSFYSAWLVRADWEPSRIEYATMDRYYGPWYERGPWPAIYGDIMLMRAALPECVVYYGADTDPDYLSPEATDEYLAEIWRHYLGPDGNRYREESRAFSEALNARRP